MEFLVNDLSMHGQFHDLTSFQRAVARIMMIRQRIRQHGYELACHKNLQSSQVTSNLVMLQAVGAMTRPARRAWLQWLTRQGPFWEDTRLHDGSDWLEVNGAIVTDSAVGEAAICVSRGLPRDLVSFEPSSWSVSPIAVSWIRDDGSTDAISVRNHWLTSSIDETLEAHPKPAASWEDLATRVTTQCSRLSFAEDAFTSLRGQPFAPGAAARIRILLNTLDRSKGCSAEDGSRTIEGHRIYQDHFTGDKAWFSDSSDTEKRDFEDELTFKHPNEPSKALFCPLHGKVKTPQYRIHFSWPITANDPLYVVYVGPKLTKR